MEKSLLTIVDGLQIARAVSGEDITCDAICYQQDPERSILYGIAYQFGRRQPLVTFSRNFDEVDRSARLEYIAGDTKGLIEVGPAALTVLPAGFVEKAELHSDEIPAYWSDRRKERLKVIHQDTHSPLVLQMRLWFNF